MFRHTIKPRPQVVISTMRVIITKGLFVYSLSPTAPGVAVSKSNPALQKAETDRNIASKTPSVPKSGTKTNESMTAPTNSMANE